ncbi:hypothetical protein PFDG_05357, partial [Plasmodium falciparum Dd2]
RLSINDYYYGPTFMLLSKRIRINKIQNDTSKVHVVTYMERDRQLHENAQDMNKMRTMYLDFESSDIFLPEKKGKRI